MVPRLRYLGAHLSKELTWSCNTSCLVTKTNQHLCFLRKLRSTGVGSSAMRSFSSCVVERVLSTCITVWHNSCTRAKRKTLQWVVKNAQKTVWRSWRAQNRRRKGFFPEAETAELWRCHAESINHFAHLTDLHSAQLSYTYLTRS